MFRAVLYATGEASATDQLVLEPLEVELPHPLTSEEHRFAQTWVGSGTEVAVDLIDEGGEVAYVTDGRHRLWTTRAHHAERGYAPVTVEGLFGLDGAVDGHATSEGILMSLNRLAHWWEQPGKETVQSRTDDECRYAHAHYLDLQPTLQRRRLARAYVAASAPAALEDAWFERLRDWDNGIEVLADLHHHGRTSPELLRRNLYSHWRFRQNSSNVDQDVVVDMFRSLGFAVNGTPAQRPRGTLTLFRGATVANRAGASWTVTRTSRFTSLKPDRHLGRWATSGARPSPRNGH